MLLTDNVLSIPRRHVFNAATKQCAAACMPNWPAFKSFIPFPCRQLTHGHRLTGTSP